MRRADNSPILPWQKVTSQKLSALQSIIYTAPEPLAATSKVTTCSIIFCAFCAFDRTYISSTQGKTN